MKSGARSRKYRFPLVRPAFPEPAAWVPFLKDSYDQHWFSNFGPVATRLEHELTEEFAEVGDAFVVTASATAGLAACLIAARITGPVLLPAFTFPASASAIRMAGAEPALVDVDSANWACDLSRLERALDETGARAVMLVAPFGIAQDFSAHIARAEARGAVVIIDNAAGLGGNRQRRAYRGNALEVFSLHATKPFAVGEGGAIEAPEARVEALRSALNFGLPWQAGMPSRWGINGKMPEPTAAIGLAALRDYRAIVADRQRQVQRYVALFDRFDDIAVYRGPIADSPWQAFPALLPTPEAASDFVAEAARHGLEVRRYYRPSLAEWGGIATAGNCAVSKLLAERMICLPVYSRASDGEIAALHRIVDSCLEKSLAVLA